ncbi:reverse transcriptase domain-containing protein [Tanacetum coccineum]
MKKVIVELPLLTTPKKEETLYVYLAAAAEAVSAVLSTKRKGKQCLIHYVSRTLNEAERNYAMLEKLSLSLLHMSRRLHQYFKAHPIKRPQWEPSRSPSRMEYTYSLCLNFMSMNNEAEYEALVAGIRMAARMKVQNIDVKVDSKLVAKQINKSYVANSIIMIKYLTMAKECIAGFKSFTIHNIPKNLNQKADILSKLAIVAFDHLTKEANYVIGEIHMGACRMHSGPRSVVEKAIRQG